MVSLLKLKYPCETFSKQILPALRSLIAQGLIEKYGMTQTAAAKKLGTTQAAISYYLSSKRGEKYVKQLKNDSQVRSTINEIINGLAMESLSSNEFMEKLCELCIVLRKNEKIIII